MKKLFVLFFILILTGCSKVSPEEVTKGVKNSFSDIVDIQPILLYETSGATIVCDADNIVWGVFRLKSNEVYLGKFGTLDQTTADKKANKFTFVICYKQKMF